MEDKDLYQDFIIELYKNPLNHGRMADADYHAQLDNPTCGDRIELFIRMEKDVVVDAKFIGQGCAISQASASLFTSYIKGKKFAALGKISPKDVLKLIKIDLSKNPARMKCALLPFEAMRKAAKLQ
jgi:nitrogen fixation NifU-like protein